MSNNFFFKNKGPFSIKKIIKTCGGKAPSEVFSNIKIQDIIDLANINNCSHIYLGANQSFTYKNEADITEWEYLVIGLLKEEFHVTLDIDIKFYQHILDTLSLFKDENNFTLMLSVKIPYMEECLNYNACLKLDDTDFNATNPGVWVHRIHELKSLDKFTNWEQYKSDKPI